MILSNSEFKKKISDFLQETGMAPTTFGTKAKNDPSFVARVMSGQSVNEEGKKKVIAFIDSYKAADND